MTTPPLLIHIGYHKTATTWLQSQFFRDHHGFKKILDHQEVFDLITRPHGLAFDPAYVRKELARRIAEIADDMVPVISSEILSGNPFFGGRESDVFADRLARIWPEARILITIRSQLRILPSVYMQYLQRGGTLHHSRFFTEEGELGYTWFSPIHFEYDRLFSKYQDLFGKKFVYVMQQELLAKNPEQACSDFARFSQAKKYDGLIKDSTKTRGASYPEYSAWALRRVNQLQGSVLNRQPIVKLGTNPDGLYRATGHVFSRPILKKMYADRRPVSLWVRKAFAGKFAESNRKLAETSCNDLDLSDYE
jgi:hypothetical protein